jgi:hypothetical protein
MTNVKANVMHGGVCADSLAGKHDSYQGGCNVSPILRACWEVVFCAQPRAGRFSTCMISQVVQALFIVQYWNSEGKGGQCVSELNDGNSRDTLNPKP